MLGSCPLERWTLRRALLALAACATLLLAGCSSGNQGSQAGETNQAENREATISQVEQAARPLGGAWPVAEVAAEVEPSVVQVNVEAERTTASGTREEARGLGSGVIYRDDGYIITNSHVVEGADQVNVAFADGTAEEAEVVGGDPSTASPLSG